MLLSVILYNVQTSLPNCKCGSQARASRRKSEQCNVKAGMTIPVYFKFFIPSFRPLSLNSYLFGNNNNWNRWAQFDIRATWAPQKRFERIIDQISEWEKVVKYSNNWDFGWLAIRQPDRPRPRPPVGVVHDEDRRAIAIAAVAATAAEPSIKFRSLEIFFPRSDHNWRGRERERGNINLFMFVFREQKSIRINVDLWCANPSFIGNFATKFCALNGSSCKARLLMFALPSGLRRASLSPRSLSHSLTQLNSCLAPIKNSSMMIGDLSNLITGRLGGWLACLVTLAVGGFTYRARQNNWPSVVWTCARVWTLWSQSSTELCTVKHTPASWLARMAVMALHT